MRLITTMEMRDFEQFLNSQQEVDDFIDSVMADVETLEYLQKLKEEQEINPVTKLVLVYFKGAA